MSIIISPNVFDFLRALDHNNNREWFTLNKNLYQDSQENIIAFLDHLIEEMGKFDDNLLKLDAKKALFRIYRDTRFSKDKIPYKTNFGASLGMGKGNQKAGYYVHMEPGKSFLAGGIHMPDSPTLKEVRKEISMNGDEFLKIINNKNFKKHFPELSQEQKLVKIPQGFENDDAMGDYLKLKSFIVVYNLKDSEVLDANAAKKFSEIFEIIKPFNDFINASLL